MPYEEYGGDRCSCDCCFSITFEIAGLKGKTYDVYFKDTKVVLSADHYAVVNPSSQLYQGKEIDRLNKYGFREGTWMTFYKDSAVRTISDYPDEELYHQSYPVCSKKYYPSQKLHSWERKDTSETWFEDGELQYQRIEYKAGDTAYEKGFSKYENRRLSRNYFERRYPLQIKSEFDSTYDARGTIWEIIYEEKYFENGKLQYRFGKDTSYTWFRNGRVKLRDYKSGSMEYDESGRITKREFHWKEPGPVGDGDLDHSIYMTFHKNGVIKEIDFRRFEVDEVGIGKSYYEWEWDSKMKLIASPKDWKEPLPWKRFKDIIMPQQMYRPVSVF